MRIQPTQDIYHRDPYDIARYRAKLLLVENGGPAPSLQFQAVLRALTLASATGQQFVDEVGNKPFRMEKDALCPLDLARLGHLKPWAIPTRARLSALKKAWPKRWWFFDEPEKKHRLSAAAIAIHFLETLPTTTRSQLRRIVLNEDLPSSPDPWSHASGLVPFCKANPLLCIERRASVWKTVLQDNDDQSPICASLIGFQTSRWIAEAHSLVAQGMPNGSFSLLFDGDPAPAASAAFFQSVLHRDTAWQEAFAALRGLGIGGWRQLLWHTHFDGMPQIMRDISSGKSNIRCNFDPGEPEDFQKIVDRHRQSSQRDLKIDYASRQPRFIEQLAPPHYHKIGHECWWTTTPEVDDAQIRQMAETDLRKGCYVCWSDDESWPLPAETVQIPQS